MRTWLYVLGLYVLTLAAPGAAELTQVQVVYILPMANGLDQYLANRLTSERVYQVVTEPGRADAVFTDQIGQGFEQRLVELYPPPEPPKTEEKETDKDKEAARSAKIESAGRSSSFSRGKGNVFLVDLKTRRVLWSVFQPPKRIAADEMNRTSARIVEQLRKDLGRK